MKTSREALEEYLIRFFPQVLADKEINNKVINYCNDKYNYPEVRVSDLLQKRITLSEASDFDLFVLLDGITSNINTKNKITTYFTETEIQNYSKAKYKRPKKIGFPLRFNMIQIADDQWIGRTTARELVSLRNSGIIRYNVNIQRTMKVGMRGKTQEYRITENKASTAAIRESLEEGKFISNTITLNIPDDGVSDFNFEDGVLTIRKANSLDIIDGFHRLIALEQAANMDPDFDYPMELRISHYSESKGQRFVYQEDQKTKMRKVDSDSFNVEDEAVKATNRLNDDALFNLNGQISRNGGLISFAEMAAILKKLYFTGVGKREARVKGIEVSKNLRQDFNLLTEYDTKFLTETYDFNTLCVCLVAFKYFRDNEIPADKQSKAIQYVLDNMGDDLKTRLSRRMLSGPTINLINKKLEEVT